MESFLTNVIGACVAGAVFVSCAGWPSTSWANETAPATRAAISAMFVGGDAAQRAIDVDVCSNVDQFIDTTRAGDALTGNDAREYKHMRDALNAAFDAAQGGDESLQIVVNDYCANVSER